MVGDCGLWSVHCFLASYVPFQKGMRPLRAGSGVTPRDSIPKPSRVIPVSADAPLSPLSVLSVHPLLPSSYLCLPGCLISLPLSSSSAIFQSCLTCFFPVASVSALFHASLPISLFLLYALIAAGMGEVSRWVCSDKASDGLPFSGSPIIGAITPCHPSLPRNR